MRLRHNYTRLDHDDFAPKEIHSDPNQEGCKIRRHS